MVQQDSVQKTVIPSLPDPIPLVPPTLEGFYRFKNDEGKCLTMPDPLTKTTANDWPTYMENCDPNNKYQIWQYGKPEKAYLPILLINP